MDHKNHEEFLYSQTFNWTYSHFPQPPLVPNNLAPEGSGPSAPEDSSQHISDPLVEKIFLFLVGFGGLLVVKM